MATLTQQNRNSLNRMENYIVRRLRELARDPHETTDTHVLLKGRTIERKCMVHRMRFWGHVKRRPSYHILRRALRYRAHGRLKVGRPCYTWHDSIESDVRKSNITMESWEETVGDAALHNSKCKTLYTPDSHGNGA